MVDFIKHLSPEAQARIKSRREAHERYVKEARDMDSATLCDLVEYFLSQCEFPHRYQPGDPVYDGAIAHVYLPELLRRVRGAVCNPLKQKHPPTGEQVLDWPWWWNYQDGLHPRVMELRYINGQFVEYDGDVAVRYMDLAKDCPGEWAPCIPPID